MTRQIPARKYFTWTIIIFRKREKEEKRKRGKDRKKIIIQQSRRSKRNFFGEGGVVFFPLKTIKTYPTGIFMAYLFNNRRVTKLYYRRVKYV